VVRDCSAAADWHPHGAAKLWIYNLHYFEDLNATDAAARSDWHRRLLERWVAENPPGPAEAWEPYPVSRRIVSWVKWAASGNSLPPACHASLAVQARWLVPRLEYRLLGNHLLANAKALVHAGLYFEGREAEGWLRRGLALLERELPVQLLPDGGHFELSTMYHAAALEDLLDLVNLLRACERSVPAAWPANIASMRRWLHVMTHPDGEISFFNDAAFGIAPPPAQLEAYATRLGLSPAPAGDAASVVLESSGYVRLAAGPALALCDCAALGPDYLPAHGHADTLSFELSLADRRVLVNSGTSLYGDSAERNRQRGTAAHNTVVVDGRDSSEVWGGFRVARRARARLERAPTGTPAVLEASHDGYRRLPGRNLHRRRWSLDRRSLEIRDELSGGFASAEAYFHLHPEVEARARGAVELELTWPGGAARMAFEGAAAVSIADGRWHPRFGVAEPNHCVVARLSGPILVMHLTWADRS
jgi:uncharacterized heparinase superfamily protein